MRAAPLCPFCSWVAKSGPCMSLPLGVVVAGALPGGGREERMEQGGDCSPHAHAGHAVACSFFTHQSGGARGEDSHRTAPAPVSMSSVELLWPHIPTFSPSLDPTPPSGTHSQASLRDAGGLPDDRGLQHRARQPGIGCCSCRRGRGSPTQAFAAPQGLGFQWTSRGLQATPGDDPGAAAPAEGAISVGAV
eukprot:scaffold21419_cov112-Isochrysis_galbana.AAC.3